MTSPEIPVVDIPAAWATSPKVVVRFLVGGLAATCGVPAEQVEAIVREVMRREELASTGIGRGLAIPHVRHEAVRDVGMLLGRLPSPVDWNAIDGEAVHRVCLILSPPHRPGGMLRTLEWVARALQETPPA